MEKIIVAGSSYSSGFNSDYLIIRYNADGTIDNTFGSSANGIVITSVASTDEDRGKAVKLQADGKIVVAGSSCTGVCDFVLLRYNNSEGATSIEDWSYNSQLSIYPNPNNGQFTLQAEKGGIFELMDIAGRVLNTYTINNVSETIQIELPSGMYFIREKGSGATRKLMIE